MTAKSQTASHLNLGAWPTEEGVTFRVWAPKCKSIAVVFQDKTSVPFPLKAEKNGYFSGCSADLKVGTLYKFLVDGKEAFPDPCSRYQPQGPHGPSMVVDPQNFKWTDEIWQKKGIELPGQVIYEVHIGAFSQEGTYGGLIKELPELKKLGITLIEIMPLAEFPGRWNWGYDGVGLFAPAHVYGPPDELKRLIDSAHQVGIGMMLDVVYNHFGPDGNYLRRFSEDYFTSNHTTDWGEAINFDGPHCKEVRKFFLANACYWIKEFHFDALRLDATQNIYDASPLHILAEITKSVRDIAAPKKVLLVAENESQDVKLMDSLEKGGYGIDALWNDDFHHTAQVAISGFREAYYTDYLGSPQEFISLLKRGFAYQGQYYSWQKQNRGTYVPDDIRAHSFVNYLQNHDQVANSLTGQRFTDQTDLNVCRALTALFLLAPQTPLIFMGQEFAASSPFHFFIDHHQKLASLVFKGRREFLAQFPSLKAAADKIVDPQDPENFKRSKLKLAERMTHQPIYQLHMDLLKLRREDPVFKQQDRKYLDGAVLAQKVFVLRYKGRDTDRLLVVNLGRDLDFSPCPEPLLAPLPGRPWQFLWSSEDPQYGGKGNGKAFSGKQWFIPGYCSQIYSS